MSTTATAYINSHVGPSSLYTTYSEHPEQKDAFAREAIKSHLIPEAVSELFFSAFNINLLHDAVRYMVYKRSGQKYVIERQSEIDMKIIMRSVYMQHCKHLPYDIVGQTKELNGMVIEEAVQRILVEIPMYLYYRSDVINMRQPIDRAANVSSAGTKTLEVMRIK